MKYNTCDECDGLVTDFYGFERCSVCGKVYKATDTSFVGK